MNYGTLRARIEDDLKRSDLSAQISLAIQDAVQHYADTHFWFNETRLTATVSSSTSAEYYDLPTDCLELLSVRLTHGSYTYELDLRGNEFIHRIATSPNWKGQPEIYAVYNNQYRLYPVPDQTYVLTLEYTRELTAVSATTSLSGTSDAAWYSLAYDLIKARAKADILENLIRGTEAIQEAQVQRAREQQALDRLETRTNRRRASGTLQPWV